MNTPAYRHDMLKEHPQIKLLFKDEYYQYPDKYILKGTPSTSQHTGDFNKLKKAHIASFTHKCTLCKIYPVIIKHQSNGMKYNICEKCELKFLD